MLWVRTGSAFPTTSHARKATVVVAVSLNGPAYGGLDVVGVVPSVVYRITETPEPVSVAASPTSA